MNQTSRQLEPECVELGTREMREIFKLGVEYYQPTIGGHTAQVEAGITDNSVLNLEGIVLKIGQPWRITFGKNFTVLFEWGGFECYTATGFSWGYGGTGPTKLVTLLTQWEFGTEQEIGRKIWNTSKAWTGVFLQR